MLKILLIDDDPSILTLLRQLLSLRGHRVDTAGSGEAGIEKLASTRYDVVVTDIKMPGLSGLDVATSVKASPGEQPPVIGISGTPWLLDDTLFDACLSKPCGKKELYDTIRRLVPDF